MMHSVLAAHGNLVVADKELSIREEVVVHPPCVVKSADADCFSAALNQDSFALPIVPPKCAKFMATVLLHDEAKANLKLVRNIQSCCPKGHVVASVSCKQHATSNCLKYSTEQLNLASGAFCVVKALHDSKAEDCMQVYIFDSASPMQGLSVPSGSPTLMTRASLNCCLKRLSIAATCT